MEALFKVFITVILVCSLIIVSSVVVGYSFGTKNIDNISETPCVVILSNGKQNPHYANEWYECKKKCNNDYAILDFKTCNCSCSTKQNIRPDLNTNEEMLDLNLLW